MNTGNFGKVQLQQHRVRVVKQVEACYKFLTPYCTLVPII